MLSRRHLRIKVYQALFAIDHNADVAASTAEKNLRHSIENIYRLYLYELTVLLEMQELAKEQIERNRKKFLAVEADLRPNYRFVENAFLQSLANSEAFNNAVQSHSIVFDESREALRKIYRTFAESEIFSEYQADSKPSAVKDKRLVKQLYGAFIVGNEVLEQLYEEQNMHWADDLDAAQAMVAKTISAYQPEEHQQLQLMPLLKSDEDMDFALKLFRETLKRGEDFDARIAEKAEHWESDRLATTDVILMRMALTEMVIYNQIPMKVSLNEYIELAKQYSTPRSGPFINGILDKLREEMLAQGEIKKIGRGLL